MPIESIAALRALSPAILGPLGVSQFSTRSLNRHTYTLYAKPLSAAFAEASGVEIPTGATVNAVIAD